MLEHITFWGLSGNAWFTIVVVVAMFAALIYTNIRTETAFLATMTALLVFGVLDFEDTFEGFSSESVVVVAILFAIVAGLSYGGVLNWMVKHLMGTPKTLSGAIVRLMMPVALLSSMLSNTTVVALFINVVKIWAKKLGIAPSKLLIPLSYAAGMGGICTLIGTPPNLIISQMYAESSGVHMNIFEPTLVGLFCLVVGVVSMVAMGKLLPNHKSPMDEADIDDYTTELTVPADSPYVGMTLGDIYQKYNNGKPFDIDLLAIKGYDSEMTTPVKDGEFIMGSDRMIVTGKVKAIRETCHRFGLEAKHMEGILESADENVSSMKTLTSALIMLAMMLLSAFNIMPMVNACLLAAFAMVIFRCCKAEQALKAIDWDILIIFAGSVCIGKAIENSGLAHSIAEGLLHSCGTNPYVVLTVVCFAAMIVTAFISNTATAAIFYPIAMTTATTLHLNPMTFCIALMVAVSSSFATPIGSPTHMLVYMPGGYKFKDFAVVGIPMTFIILIADIFITTLLFPF